MIISDCDFVICRVLDNYVLYQTDPVMESRFCASAKKVQILVDTLGQTINKPYTLEVRNG